MREPTHHSRSYLVVVQLGRLVGYAGAPAFHSLTEQSAIRARGYADYTERLRLVELLGNGPSTPQQGSGALAVQGVRLVSANNGICRAVLAWNSCNAGDVATSVGHSSA